MLFYFGVITLVLGIILGINFSFLISLFLLMFLIFGVLCYIFGGPTPKVLWVCILLFFGGVIWGFIYISYHKPNIYLQKNVDNKIELRGIVVEEPVQKEKATEVVAKTEYGKVLIFVNSYPHLSYGDSISFKGKLKLPKHFKTDSGTDFNYPGFLSKDGIFFIESYPYIKKLSSHNGNWIKENLFNFKNFLTKNMEKMIPYPESALLEGITVAGKKALPTEINNEFKRAGVSHIVVLSGYNVTIVAIVIMKIFSKFPRVISFGAGTLGIISFCILAGGTSTIVRAGIMSLAYLLARFSRREVDSNRLLFIAGLLMVIQNPLIIFYDTSFHLSFLATFGLINISPLIYKKLFFISESFVIREIISSSLSVEIFLIPYLAYSMGNLSLVALLSNILLLAFIPVTMFFGFVSSALNFIYIPLAYIPSFISFVLLRYELGVTHIMASFSFSLIKTAVPFWMPAIFYIVSLIIFITRQIFLERQANLDSQKMLQRTLPFQTEDNPTYMSVPTYQCLK